jgi:hypothetical protein
MSPEFSRPAAAMPSSRSAGSTRPVPQPRSRTGPGRSAASRRRRSRSSKDASRRNCLRRGQAARRRAVSRRWRLHALQPPGAQSRATWRGDGPGRPARYLCCRREPTAPPADEAAPCRRPPSSAATHLARGRRHPAPLRELWRCHSRCLAPRSRREHAAWEKAGKRRSLVGARETSRSISAQRASFPAWVRREKVGPTTVIPSQVESFTASIRTTIPRCLGIVCRWCRPPLGRRVGSVRRQRPWDRSG